MLYTPLFSLTNNSAQLPPLVASVFASTARIHVGTELAFTQLEFFGTNTGLVVSSTVSCGVL